MSWFGNRKLALALQREAEHDLAMRERIWESVFLAMVRDSLDRIEIERSHTYTSPQTPSMTSPVLDKCADAADYAARLYWERRVGLS